MSLKSDDLSQEMYHRIYRMIKRDVDPQNIAATVNLPLRTINSIVYKVKHGDTMVATEHQQKNQDQTVIDFLDTYLYTKTRFAVIQLVGALEKSHLYLLEAELEKTISASWKAIALRLTDVRIIDAESCDFIFNSFQRFQTLGRYLAILDPSPEVEQFIKEYNLEDKVPIFGTERAFEDAAFSKKPTFRKI